MEDVPLASRSSILLFTKAIGASGGFGALLYTRGAGDGAAIGAGAGAGAGTAGAAFTGKRDITIPAETRLRFKLKEPLEVKGK